MASPPDRQPQGDKRPSVEPSLPEPEPLSGWQRSLVLAIDRLVHGFSRHWLAVFNAAAFLYVGLPILAPVLMNAGATAPAQVIYTIYSPLCHQMTQRSFFLFGEQPAYPRALAGTELTPIEAYIDDIPEFQGIDPDNWPAFFAAARDFVGNEQLGYKMALCERDIGIYGFVLVGGLLYGMWRKRFNIKPLPLWAFVVFGMGPIALDGFTQLFSYWFALPSGEASGILATLQNIFPLRESTPTMRALTGAWFGLALVWLAYPHVNAGMERTADNLEEKLQKAETRDP
ncbi:MAG: DUF2085 domain-containing protein [Candidatus Promineifilaceae bacterium]|nr:DUF2085 domain-containing protein [Candidatus Promineifilaceae bacterium]